MGTAVESVPEDTDGFYHHQLRCPQYFTHIFSSFIGVTSVQQCFTLLTPATSLPEGLRPEENWNASIILHRRLQHFSDFHGRKHTPVQAPLVCLRRSNLSPARTGRVSALLRLVANSSPAQRPSVRHDIMFRGASFTVTSG